MSDIQYEETDDAAVLKTDDDAEWLESNSVVDLSEWD